VCTYYSTLDVVHAAWYGSFVHPVYSTQVLFLPSCFASLHHHLHVLQYTTVILVPQTTCTVLCAVVSVHPLYSTVHTMLVQRFNVAQFASIALSHLPFCKLHIGHHFLPQASISSFLSLSASCSTPVLLSLIPGEFEHGCLQGCATIDCITIYSNLLLPIYCIGQSNNNNILYC
jgi:hypothetical protein